MSHCIDLALNQKQPSIAVVLSCVQLPSRVRLFVTPWSATHQPPLSMEILQARILEWLPGPPPGLGSSQPRDRTQVSRIAGGFFTDRATREAPSCNYDSSKKKKKGRYMWAECWKGCGGGFEVGFQGEV